MPVDHRVDAVAAEEFIDGGRGDIGDRLELGSEIPERIDPNNPLNWKDPDIISDIIFSSQLAHVLMDPRLYFRMVKGALNEAEECPISGVDYDHTTKGNTRIYTKPGTASDANSDFDSQNPSDVEGKGDGIRVGTLNNGSTIVVRPGSKSGEPAVEIQYGGRVRTKIRYVR